MGVHTVPQEAGIVVQNGPVDPQEHALRCNNAVANGVGHGQLCGAQRPVGQAAEAGEGAKCGREGESATTTNRKCSSPSVFTAGATDVVAQDVKHGSWWERDGGQSWPEASAT